MGYLKKTGPNASTTALVAADQWNDHVGRISGEILADTSYEWNLANPTRFKSAALRVWHAGGNTFAYQFIGSTLSASRQVILPPLTGNDTVLFANHIQTMTGKTISVLDNSLVAAGAVAGSILVRDSSKYVPFPMGPAGTHLRVNLAGTALEYTDLPEMTGNLGGMDEGGLAVFDGDSIETDFAIPHLLSETPEVYFVEDGSTDSIGARWLEVDATNITVHYAVPPADGTDNVKLIWGAGFVDHAEISFTPTTTNTLQNKTISGGNNTFSNIPMTTLLGGHLIFDKISVPADQGDAEDILLYDKEIDVNNNTLATKQQIGGAIVEVSAF